MVKRLIILVFAFLPIIVAIFTFGGGLRPTKEILLALLDKPVVEAYMRQEKRDGSSNQGTYKFRIELVSGAKIKNMTVIIISTEQDIVSYKFTAGDLTEDYQKPRELAFKKEKFLKDQMVEGEITLLGTSKVAPELIIDGDPVDLPTTGIIVRRIDRPGLYITIWNFYEKHQSVLDMVIAIGAIISVFIVILYIVRPITSGMRKFSETTLNNITNYTKGVLTAERRKEFFDYIKSLKSRYDREDVAVSLVVIYILFNWLGVDMRFYEAIFLYFLVTRYQIIGVALERWLKIVSTSKVTDTPTTTQNTLSGSGDQK